MSINNRLICTAIIALVFIFTSCSQPKYLVKGLTLPPGSTEVSVEESSDSGKETAVTVNFDCTSNWDSVAAHIDNCMSKAGYANDSSKLEGIPFVGEAAKNLLDANNFMRSYSKADGDFFVMLVNNNWIGDSTGMEVNLAGSDYTLTVSKFEGDK